MNSMAKSFHQRPVSIAIEVKRWALESSVYLAVLFEAAWSAAATSVAVLSTYEMACMSATVMSHASGLLSSVIIVIICIFYFFICLVPSGVKCSRVKNIKLKASGVIILLSSFRQ